MVNGVSEKVLALLENVREYVFEAIRNNDLTPLEYDAFLELHISDLENAPTFEEL